MASPDSDPPALQPADSTDATVEVTGKPAASDQEMDIWWGGYAGRTMLPSFFICALLTAGFIWLAWLLGKIYDLDPDHARHLYYGMTGLVWLVQLMRWGYRLACFQYRLTSRRLFWSQGKLYPRVPPVDLALVEEVTLDQSFIEHLLRVGRIRLTVEDRPHRIILSGVARPERIVRLIEKQVEHQRPS